MWIPDPELNLEGAESRPRRRPRDRRRTRAGTALGWARARLTTTPGRLVLTSVLVVDRRGLLRRHRHRRRAVARARRAGGPNGHRAASGSGRQPVHGAVRRQRHRRHRPSGRRARAAGQARPLPARPARGKPIADDADPRRRRLGRAPQPRSEPSPTSFRSTADWSRPRAPTTARASRSAPPTCARRPACLPAASCPRPGGSTRSRPSG